MKKILSRIRLLTKSRFLVRRLQTKFIIKSLDDKKIETVLDLGAGTAPFKKFFKADTYLCIDIENRQNNDNVILADINDGIPVDDNRVDVIICFEVLEHLKKPAFVIQEINRVLRPGGKLILSTPMVWKVHEPPNDFFRYTEFGLQYLLESAGFKKYQIKQSNNYLYTLCQLINMQLENKFFIPLVIFFNVLGLLSYNVKKNNLPLENHVIAYKNEN